MEDAMMGTFADRGLIGLSPDRSIVPSSHSTSEEDCSTPKPLPPIQQWIGKPRPLEYISLPGLSALQSVSHNAQPTQLPQAEQLTDTSPLDTHTKRLAFMKLAADCYHTRSISPEILTTVADKWECLSAAYGHNMTTLISDAYDSIGKLNPDDREFLLNRLVPATQVGVTLLTRFGKSQGPCSDGCNSGTRADLASGSGNSAHRVSDEFRTILTELAELKTLASTCCVGSARSVFDINMRCTTLQTENQALKTQNQGLSGENQALKQRLGTADTERSSYATSYRHSAGEQSEQWQ